MRGQRTTRCCAVTLLALSTLAAAPSRQDPPLSLFPVVTVWSLALNNRLTVPPAYDATRAYFPIEGGRIVAYLIGTGALQWTVLVEPEMPLIAGGGLLLVVSSHTLIALRPADGSAAWQVPLEEKLAVPPVWDNGWIVLATTSGAILAIRADDGRLIWRRDLGSAAHAAPALAADRVYVSTLDRRVVALRVDTGSPIWERKLGGPPNDILALDERLYVGSTDNFFYCLDTKDGHVDWRWRTGGDVIGVPAFDDNSVYFLSLDNILRALNRKSGVQRWLRLLPLRPTTGPVMANGTLVVTGLAPMLRGYSAADGSVAGELPTPGEIAAPPHLVGRMGSPLPQLVIVTRDLAKGASAILVTRSVEPPLQPFAVLPNPIVQPFSPRGQEATGNPAEPVPR